MEILVLGNQTYGPYIQNPDYYDQAVAFFRNAAPGDTLVAFSLLSQLLFEIDEGQLRARDTHNDRDLKEYDALFIRDMARHSFDIAFALSRYMRDHGKLVVNDYSHIRTFSKLSQAVLFAENGLPTPRTIAGHSQVLVEYPHPLDLPYICKDAYGAHGNNNFLITKRDELEAVLGQRPDQVFVLQEFIPNDGDYRVLYVGKKQLIIKRKSVDGSHLNNTSQGGSAELLPNDALPEAVLLQGRNFIEQLGMAIAGVDLIYDQERKRYLFLEVNSQPQLVTGAFVDEKQKLLGDYLSDLSAAA